MGLYVIGSMLFWVLVSASLMWVIVDVALDWLGGCCILCYSGSFSDLLRSADSKLHYCTGDFGVIWWLSVLGL